MWLEVEAPSPIYYLNAAVAAVTSDPRPQSMSEPKHQKADQEAASVYGIIRLLAFILEFKIVKLFILITEASSLFPYKWGN